MALRPFAGESFDHLEDFPLEQLANKFSAGQGSTTNIPELLKILHTLLIEQTTYCRSILLLDVVKLFKTIYASQMNPSSEDEPLFSNEEFTELEIENISAKVERALKEKIVITYLIKGKLNGDQADTSIRDLRFSLGSIKISSTPLAR